MPFKLHKVKRPLKRPKSSCLDQLRVEGAPAPFNVQKWLKDVFVVLDVHSGCWSTAGGLSIR